MSPLVAVKAMPQPCFPEISRILRGWHSGCDWSKSRLGTALTIVLSAQCSFGVTAMSKQRNSNGNLHPRFGGIVGATALLSLASGLLLAVAVALTGCGGTTSATSTTAVESGNSAKKGQPGRPSVTLLNVSYDPTRELYSEFNKEFAKHWMETQGQVVDIKQSHGGSGAQARSVIDGLKADVVTLAIAYDIDQIADLSKTLPPNWQDRLPNDSSPYRSTVVFLVRKGNPKDIKDWSDLVKPGVEVITSNPKTSGAGRLAYLAGWGYALKANNNDESKAREYITSLYQNVPVLDSGARGSTTTFVQRGIGDVLLAWENEALLAIKELGPDQVELVVPSISVLAEPPVALVDKNADAKGTTEVAKAYLEFLYTPAGQKIAVKHYYRPSEPEFVDAEVLKQFPELTLFSVKEVFGSWKAANDTHFKEGGVFDSIYAPQ
jgi:sulfate transport system substrate-binding protein